MLPCIAPQQPPTLHVHSSSAEEAEAPLPTSCKSVTDSLTRLGNRQAVKPALTTTSTLHIVTDLQKCLARIHLPYTCPCGLDSLLIPKSGCKPEQLLSLMLAHVKSVKPNTRNISPFAKSLPSPALLLKHSTAELTDCTQEMHLSPQPFSSVEPVLPFKASSPSLHIILTRTETYQTHDPDRRPYLRLTCCQP